MKRIVYLLSTILTIVIGISFVQTAWAAADNNVGFDIQAVIPANQVDKTQSYFDLRVKPGTTQKIQIVVNNTSESEGQYEVSVNQAYTNKNGFIDYALKDVSLDKSVPFKLKDIVDYPTKIQVAPRKAEIVTLTLSIPVKKFNGQVLGGIQVTKLGANKKETIKNQYSYVIGLNLTESDSIVKRNLELVSVKPAVSFEKTSIVAKLKNPVAEAMGHLKYEGTVVSKDDNKTIKKIDYNTDMSLAPNSIYDFAIDWDGKPLEAGVYTLHLTVSDALKNVWNFDEDFTITRQEASEINKVTIDQVNNTKLPLWVYAVIGVLAALLLFLILIMVFKRKNKRQ
ncbi:DUF916 and DUF3324 domain-containing protein [Enterococcus montenegrensis]|uniref:DUF916 and DUF3324 domain-containing protein n=1 Tax=Enterococcus montenegrensis TaxID=3031993 RepID=UPI00249E601D|nr:DUF916 and DUF3324 domain-containing protein [Enterococcus montenegrensis]WHA09124.1 DUF916 and DUF3324 domain-containing protein [Enterococcus montenegrensis]